MAKSSCKIRIEAMQTVIPANPTFPRISTKLLMNPNDSPIFPAAAFHVVLFFKKAWDRDSGWIQAGWIKESLGRALNENPIFAGRLRRCSDTGGMEIVGNDSGVRLVEARVDLTMAEFLTAAEEADDASQLVFWDDLPEENTDFSPLLYVQVTNFSCGGYSLGISCSLMLADPFTLVSFLNTWINRIHRQISDSRRDESEYPMFYHPHLRKSNSSPTLFMSNVRTTAAETAVFDIRTTTHGSDYKDLAELCIENAERELGRKKKTINFGVVIRGSSESDGEIRFISRSDGKLDEISDNRASLSMSMRRGWEKEVGWDKFWLNEGKKAEHCCCWISNSSCDQGFILILPSIDVTTIIITFP